MTTELISISIFWEAQQFLRIINEGKVLYSDLENSYLKRQASLTLIELEKVIDFCSRSGQIILENDKILPTQLGKDILKKIPSNNSSVPAARIQFLSYIREFRPFWATSLTKGRKKSMTYVPEIIRDIFEQLQLYDSNKVLTDKEVVSWWDEISTALYSSAQANNIKVGRIGERLSMLYEEYRTGSSPVWVALEDNSAGYDLYSVQSNTDETSMCVEVKTCSSKDSNVHISKNEWRTADSKPPSAYVFHIWDISSINTPLLHIISPNVFKSHVPKNSGIGEWNDCVFKYPAIVKEKAFNHRVINTFPNQITEFLKEARL